MPEHVYCNTSFIFMLPAPSAISIFCVDFERGGTEGCAPVVMSASASASLGQVPIVLQWN